MPYLQNEGISIYNVTTPGISQGVSETLRSRQRRKITKARNEKTRR